MGGPGRFGGQDFGYYLYSELEGSGSYYRESGVEQTMLQASFDADLTDRLQVQFGGMYDDFTGNQIAGWNRLTQELVDRGTYVTGQPLPLDTDGDGLISHREFDVGGDGFTDLNPFAAGLIPGSPEAIDPGGSGDGDCSIGGAFDTSRLREVGLKGSLLDNSLYFALSLHEQQRTDFSAQATVTNQASETTGAVIRPGRRAGRLDVHRGRKEPDRRAVLPRELPEPLRRSHRPARTAAKFPGARAIPVVGERRRSNINGFRRCPGP